eukprot:TRINITY_DN11536_c0_g1_i10.p2 TRINITY_DN11536_c0_g1~~TRINITY_DN11536_c0_g1_i10.p2  ORF type:complete len:261 (+),score=14.11 TRINITY_DN11536_c0_g1_i10:2495-3277(+)
MPRADMTTTPQDATQLKQRKACLLLAFLLLLCSVAFAVAFTQFQDSNNGIEDAHDGESATRLISNQNITNGSIVDDCKNLTYLSATPGCDTADIDNTTIICLGHTPPILSACVTVDPTVTNLILAATRFTTLPLRLFSAATSLTRISLVNGDHLHLEPDVFADAHSLTTLEISGLGAATNITAVLIGLRANLKELSLQDVGIELLTTNLFAGQALLQSLFITDNPVTNLSSAAFRSTPDLAVLDLSGTPLTQISVDSLAI